MNQLEEHVRAFIKVKFLIWNTQDDLMLPRGRFFLHIYLALQDTEGYY